MIGVCIVTYNQEQYISQCIDSALNQQCEDVVRVYVGNDCSTDNTADICRTYSDRIIVVNREKNLGLVGNTLALLQQMQEDGCDYIAMLDGDDYWTHPQKLQMQLDYLKEHPEYGLVHTYVDLLYPDGSIHRDKRTKVKEGNVFDSIENYQIGNCSVMFRSELLKLIDFEEFRLQGLKSCDYSMYAIFASRTSFGFIPQHTAVWRRGIESISGSAYVEKQIAYYQNDIAHWKYLSKLFPDRFPYSEENGQAHLHKRAFNVAFRYGDRRRALAEAKQMKQCDIDANRLKIFCAHSKILVWLWNKMHQIRQL